MSKAGTNKRSSPQATAARRPPAMPPRPPPMMDDAFDELVEMEAASRAKTAAGGKGQRLTVALRIRPLNKAEKDRGFNKIAQAIEGQMVVLQEPEPDKNDPLRQKRQQDKQFVFDMAFDQEASQEEVYEKTTRDILDFVLGGYHATIFAYGPTGAGKTHTMVGVPSSPGIMVRALNELFVMMNEATEDDQFDVTMSYLEIYNENIRDLLRPGTGNLDLREDARTNEIKVAGLLEVKITNTDMVMNMLQKGNKNRTVEATAANATSSRSHALLMVNVNRKSKMKDTKGKIKAGRLFMVDLAGSERASQTKNRGQRLNEGAHINRSLLALANCINALAKGDAKYVNFRDSKLTRLLKDALSGNCKTVMIAHIAPTIVQKEESFNTLVYADRAKNISNKLKKNVVDVKYHVNQYQEIINDLKGEIQRLKTKIDDDGDMLVGKQNKPSLPAKKLSPEEEARRKAEQEALAKLKALQDDLVQNFKRQMELKHELLDVENNMLALAMEYERQQLIVKEYEADQMVRGKKPKNLLAKLANVREVAESGASPVDQEIMITEAESDVEDDDEPEDVAQAMDELTFIIREQARYDEMKEDIEKELDVCRLKAKSLEEELPRQINTQEQREVYMLLLRVHELEIERTELQRDALLREHQLRRRDLLLVRHEMQRNLCDQIITRQRQLITDHGAAMPEDLEKLYEVYVQELQLPAREREVRLTNELGLFKYEGLNTRVSSAKSRVYSDGKLPQLSRTGSQNSAGGPLFVKTNPANRALMPIRPGSSTSVRSLLSVDNGSSDRGSTASAVPSLPPIAGSSYGARRVEDQRSAKPGLTNSANSNEYIKRRFSMYPTLEVPKQEERFPPTASTAQIVATARRRSRSFDSKPSGGGSSRTSANVGTTGLRSPRGSMLAAPAASKEPAKKSFLERMKSNFGFSLQY